MQNCACHIIRVKKLSPGRSCTPDDHFICSVALCIIELTQQCRNDVALLQVVLVTGPIKIGGHLSMSTYFNGREIFLINGLPENTSRDSVETMGSGTGKWQAR